MSSDLPWQPECGELVRLRLYGGGEVERVFCFSMPRYGVYWEDRTEEEGTLAFLRHKDGVEGGLLFTALEHFPGAVAKAVELGLEEVNTWILTFDMSRVSRILSEEV